MKVDKFLPHFVTVALLVMSAVFHSPAHAFASVTSVLGILVHEFFRDRVAAIAAKQQPDEALKRAVQDLNARVVTLEHGVRTRGF